MFLFTSAFPRYKLIFDAKAYSYCRLQEYNFKIEIAALEASVNFNVTSCAIKFKFVLFQERHNGYLAS